jgi:hypothetical protein
LESRLEPGAPVPTGTPARAPTPTQAQEASPTASDCLHADHSEPSETGPPPPFPLGQGAHPGAGTPRTGVYACTRSLPRTLVPGRRSRKTFHRVRQAVAQPDAPGHRARGTRAGTRTVCKRAGDAPRALRLRGPGTLHHERGSATMTCVAKSGGAARLFARCRGCWRSPGSAGDARNTPAGPLAITTLHHAHPCGSLSSTLPRTGRLQLAATQAEIRTSVLPKSCYTLRPASSAPGKTLESRPNARLCRQCTGYGTIRV